MSRPIQLPPPANWQDFESLCLELYSAEWDPGSAQLIGVGGQTQKGVDISGTLDGKVVGVQCKLRDQWSSRPVTIGQVQKEVAKASRFAPQLDQYIIATTARRDAALQEAVRSLSRSTRFDLRVDAWDDLRHRLERAQEVRDRFYGWDAEYGDFALQRDAYLDALWNRLRVLPMAAIRQADDEAPALDEVYTALDLESREPVVRAVSTYQNFVLLGPAGSGKTAFSRFLALCLAGLARSQAHHWLQKLVGADGSEEIWPHGALIPLFVELRAFVADSSAFPTADTDIDADHLLRHLESDGAQFRIPSGFAPFIRRELSSAAIGGRGVFLILDGLDETPARPDERTRLKSVIKKFAKAYPAVRILVTSRPYAYREKDTWRLDGFQDDVIAPLSPRATEHFVRGWYKHLAHSGHLGSADVGSRPDQLLDRIRREPSLVPLSERPLTLTLITSLDAAGELRQGGRAAIYERCIELFFDKWNKVRLAKGVEVFTERFKLERDDVLSALRDTAFRVHREQGEGEGDQPASIPATLLYEALREAGADFDAINVSGMVDYLEQRSGLLLSDQRGFYRFPHRSFQEFLAGQFLSFDDDFPIQDLPGRDGSSEVSLADLLASDPMTWREVLTYVVLDCAQKGMSSKVWDLVGQLIDGNSEREDVSCVRLAGILAQAVAESASLKTPRKRSKTRDRRIDDIRRRLIASLDRGYYRVYDRIEAANALAKIGDPRLADFDSNLLPRGAGLRLARFPVTVGEFAEFVEDGAYEDVEWWRPDGASPPVPPADWSDQLRSTSSPVVSVTWFDAIAWCRWKTARVGAVVRLPTPTERRFFAEHPDGAWPWGGEEPNEERANYGSKVGGPTPVGCYITGAGKHGHLDLAGNVWEWCGLSATAEKGKAPDYVDVAGGSWNFLEEFLEVGRLFEREARRGYGDVGFRVLVSERGPHERPADEG